MDLLFKRYASPFLFIDGMMQTGRFSEFVSDFVKAINEENEEKTTWEIYLHKVDPSVSYTEFVESIKNNEQLQEMTEEDKASTVKMALGILNNFNPERGE